MLTNLTSAISWIESQIKFKPKTDLNRMQQAYEMLHLDLSKMKKIHVAGTNGKGSVCAYLTHILMEAGYKVGTYTSPYLISFNERIKLQFENISDDDLFNLIKKVYDFNFEFEKQVGEFLSFFELLTLMALIYFQDQEVDVIVMEVGLGGLLDATNILNYDLSLITSIGYDHMKQLGPTLESIASNKLGIVKQGNHLITTVDSSLKNQFKDYVDHVSGTVEFYTLSDLVKLSDYPLTFTHENETYQLSLLGDYQLLNALLSIKAIHYLYPHISNEMIKDGLFKTKWAGRLEKLEDQVYLDGAHNTHAIDQLNLLSKTLFKDKHIIVIFSALADKEIDKMLYILKSFASKVILTSFNDSRYISLKPYENEDFIYIEKIEDAISFAKKEMNKDSIILFTGSLHFAGFIKKLYLTKQP